MLCSSKDESVPAAAQHACGGVNIYLYMDVMLNAKSGGSSCHEWSSLYLNML